MKLQPLFNSAITFWNSFILSITLSIKNYLFWKSDNKEWSRIKSHQISNKWLFSNLSNVYHRRIRPSYRARTAKPGGSTVRSTMVPFEPPRRDKLNGINIVSICIDLDHQKRDWSWKKCSNCSISCKIDFEQKLKPPGLSTRFPLQNDV